MVSAVILTVFIFFLMQLFLRGICQPVRNTFDSHSMLVLILVNIKYCQRQASMSTTSTSTYPT